MSRLVNNTIWQEIWHFAVPYDDVMIRNLLLVILRSLFIVGPSILPFSTIAILWA